MSLRSSLATALAVPLLVSGCSSAPKAPPTTTTAASPTTVAAPEPAPTPAPEPPAAPVQPSTPQPETQPERQSAPGEDPLTVRVIESGDPAEHAEATDLVAAAAAERRRRRELGPPTVVIDNRSLEDYAGIEITFAAPAGGIPEADEEGDEEAGGVPDEADEPRDELYWRQRVLDVRMRWREAHDEIERIQAEIAGLRRRFYAEDDPHYRDTQVKPAWDRAIDRARQATAEAAAAREELAALLEEGRRAGAHPGWLREGIDIEPPTQRPPRDGAGPRQPEEAGIYEPQEPATSDPPRRDGGGGGR